ncbi:hypothetical protein ONZ45_g4270 [Pleurotus djamor]|nr:hypothetical protein ONZ45_g4270 [Pleurotus djamor]
MDPSYFSDQNSGNRSNNRDPYGVGHNQHPGSDLSRPRYSHGIWRDMQGQEQYDPVNLPNARYHPTVPQGSPQHRTNGREGSSVFASSPYPASSHGVYPIRPWYEEFRPQYPEYPSTSAPSPYDYKPEILSAAPSFSQDPPGGFKQEMHSHAFTSLSPEPPARRQIATNAVINAAERRRINPHKYFCHICPTAFTAKHNLTRHESAHNNEKPYQCERCQSSFTTKADLKRHMHKSKKHSEPLPA